MSNAVADALRATIPADRPPVADEGTVAVPVVGGGEILAGPGTDIPAPPAPPASLEEPVVFPASPPTAGEQPAPERPQRARPERPPRVPVGERASELRWRWSIAPSKFRWPMIAAAVAIAGLGVFKWVVPWAMPEPVVVAFTQEAPTTTAAGAPPTVPVDQIKPFGWAPWPVGLSARAMIGVQATGDLNPLRATDVAQQAQQKIRDEAVSPCQLRLIVPAPGRLDVTVEDVEGAVPLFNCTAPTSPTTTAPAGS